MGEHMPLEQSASKEAFGDNVAAERGAGKPEKQAIAIAYSVQRKAQGKSPRTHERKSTRK